MFVFDTIDDILDGWQKLFISALDEHAPMRSKRVRKKRQPDWMSPEILHLINERDKLLRKVRVTNSVSDWSEYRLARNKATCKLREGKRKYYQSALRKNRSNPKRLWKHKKNLAGSSIKTGTVKCTETSTFQIWSKLLKSLTSTLQVSLL